MNTDDGDGDDDNDNDPTGGDVETANLESDDFDLSQRLVILIRLQSDEIDRDLQRNINIDKLQKYQRLIRPWGRKYSYKCK